nr:maleylpyruvate isomerase family mycothiol-dependent enzyme [Nesterenkonia alkaliphila]
MTEDPELKEALLVVRRGTAFFTRMLNLLPDQELDGPSLLPGWTRRHLVAHVGYNARAITRLVQWANTGVETPMYSSPEARAAEIEFGATLPAHALRHLNDHAAISLNVEWRDTPEDAWNAVVRTAQGREVPLSETVWMRTREVWLHAVDLNNGARFDQIPVQVLSGLLRDITAKWRRAGEGEDLRVEVVDAPELSFGEGTRTVRGDLSGVLAWAAGRASHLVTRGNEVEAPRWI